jgi:predicted nucleic acid-binding protein
LYLVDTNVLSELRRSRRSPEVVAWLAGVPADGLYLSVVTVGEIAKGIAKVRRGRSTKAAVEADALQSWLEGLLSEHSQRILPVTVPIATRWGRLCDVHPELATDMLIAATALEHDLTVATRNVDHFRPAYVRIVNPFGSS